MSDTRLDRELQRQILSRLAQDYPGRTQELGAEPFVQCPEFLANLAYLQDHGLVAFTFQPGTQSVISAGITAEGLDFIADDGGLTELKRTITVRPDIESFAKILERHAGSLPEPEKTNLLNAVADFAKPVVQAVIVAAIRELLGMG